MIARMSGGCYKETASVEFQLDHACQLRPAERESAVKTIMSHSRPPTSNYITRHRFLLLGSFAM